MNDRMHLNSGSFLRSLRGRRRRHGVFVVLIGLAVALAACSSGGNSTPSTTAPAQAPPSSSSSGGGVDSDSITIHNFAFSPSTISVSPGATVTVTNKDQVTHTLTAVHGQFDTGGIAAGQSKTFKAPSTPGSYAYLCSIHQFMTGTLVVSG
jgi:plastocyanin